MFDLTRRSVRRRSLQRLNPGTEGGAKGGSKGAEKVCIGSVWFSSPQVKTYTNETGREEALLQAARYGKHLKLSEVSLVLFVETIDDANRAKYEKDYIDGETGVRVEPVFVETGA